MLSKLTCRKIAQNNGFCPKCVSRRRGFREQGRRVPLPRGYAEERAFTRRRVRAFLPIEQEAASPLTCRAARVLRSAANFPARACAQKNRRWHVQIISCLFYLVFIQFCLFSILESSLPAFIIKDVLLFYNHVALPASRSVPGRSLLSSSYPFSFVLFFSSILISVLPDLFIRTCAFGLLRSTWINVLCQQIHSTLQLPFSYDYLNQS